MNLIYHHRTRCTGAEGVHIRGIQKALTEFGFRVHDISMVKANRAGQTVGEDNTLYVKMRRFFLYIVCDRLPNFVFKILELLYSTYALLHGIMFLLIKNKDGVKFDFAYDRYAYFSFGMPVLCKIFRIPLILEMNTTCLDYDVRDIKFQFLAKFIEKKCVTNSTLIVVVSKYLKKKLVESYNINTNKVVIVPNAIDPDIFCNGNSKSCNPADISTISEIKKFSKNKIIVGVVGVFVPWHGIEFLVDIFKKLAISCTDPSINIGLILVGDGPVRDSIEKKVNLDKVLSDKVFFTGMVPHDQIKDYIDFFDIAVMPDSNPFGSPMKIFEYMVMEKPILVPSYSPIEEVIKNNFNGIIFQKKNSQDCYDKLLTLLEDVDLRIKLGKNAKRVVLEKYTWQDNVKRIFAHLEILSQTT